MDVNIVFQRLESSGNLKSLIDRRIYFALSRFGPRVTGVSVLVEDNSFDRGGTQHHCEVIIELDLGDTLHVEATHADAEAAISLAANRAGSMVQRKIELWRSV